MKRIYKAGAFFLALLILGGCTTQKKKGELSGLGKLYENTTAKYNGYFNAKELLKESEAQLASQHQDNYNMMLKMFPAVAADNPQAVAANLDEAIKKVTVVVNLHRESQWTDDAYLLVGKAQYLKQDYEGAEETLRFMIEEFSPQKMAKAKAKASKKKKGKNAKSSSSRSSDKVDKDEDKPQLTKKQQAKERKKYNKQVKKNRKKANRNKGKKSKKKSSSGKKKVDDDTKIPAEEPELPAPAPEEEKVTPKITSISISDKDAPVDSDPDGYFMKHRPAYQEGVLWLARTLIERDNYEGAMRLIGQLDRDSGTFEDVRSEKAAVQAYYHIKQKDYAQALPQLEKAIELEKDNISRARYAYIMAQIYQQQGNSQEAYATFERVLKYNPPYEMAFSSRLNLAQNAYLAGKGTSEEAKRNLEKLLKDPKNQEFQDQIYFALAEIAFKEGDREEAIKNLSLSLRSGRSNGAQKAEAYLKLGRLFYEDENYISAKAYLDSTLQVLPSTDDRYNEVQTLSNNLTDIAANLEIIALQDSLLQIAMMSEEDKKALAYQIKQEQDEARRQELAAKANAADPKTPGRVLDRRLGDPSTAGALRKESSFFAYNDRSLKRGQRNFEQNWGDRKLEDNWRRANRRDIGSFGNEEIPQEVVENVIDEGDIDEYLGDYPKSENDIQQAHIEVREAMYALGSLYRERLNNIPRSVDILDQLNTRYPGSNYELDSWYVLYLDHQDLKNSAKAQTYYDKIIEKYPSTNYAKILRDPNYASQYLDEERNLNRAYDQTYQMFVNGNYQQAFSRSESAFKELYGKHPLKPKYSLLMAMCVGNLQGKDAYISDLQRVVALYPETDEQRRAKEILRMLGGAGAKLPGQAEEENSQFQSDPNGLHYILVVFKEDVNLNDVKVSISDYNRKFHNLDKIRISNIYLGTDNKTPVLVMRRYKDQAEAMRYYDGVKKNEAEFLDTKINYDIFPVTQGNYRQVLKNKSVEGYQAFFESNYLQ